MSDALDSKAVKHFKEYLRIKSVHPSCDYSECVTFLRKLAAGLCEKGLPLVVHEVAPGKPIVVITWEGYQPELSSVILSSHMDVVPVFPEQWTYDPFSAEEDGDGNIYARGAQDMKCVGIQYLEAVRRLMLQNFQPKRTVHLCFTSDEEVGCIGMKSFVETEAFKKLNAGCALDEGLSRLDDSFHLFNGERLLNPIAIICKGTPGHGSLLLDNTAGEKINNVINAFMEKRAEEKRKLETNPKLTIGDVTTINLVILEGGVQSNVVPPEFKVTFDVRLNVDTQVEEFENWVKGVCQRAGKEVSYEWISKNKKIEPTKLEDRNIWWRTLRTQFDKMGMNVVPSILPAATDSNYLRSKGVSAFNFSPINYTPVRIHAHDEFLNRKIFVKGITVYCNLISALATVED